jgi:hypothetical protein
MQVKGQSMSMIEHFGRESMLQCPIELGFEAIHVIEFVEMIADIIACGDSAQPLGGVFDTIGTAGCSQQNREQGLEATRSLHIDE